MKLVYVILPVASPKRKLCFLNQVYINKNIFGYCYYTDSKKLPNVNRKFWIPVSRYLPQLKKVVFVLLELFFVTFTQVPVSATFPVNCDCTM